MYARAPGHMSPRGVMAIALRASRRVGLRYRLGSGLMPAKTRASRERLYFPVIKRK